MREYFTTTYGLPLTLLILLMGIHLNGQEVDQDSLVAAFLKDYTYHFDIVGEKIVGDGRDILLSACEESQYVLIGEYHLSPRISQFTEALIPELDDQGYKHILFEVGPTATKFLREMDVNDGASAALKKFNTRYGYVEEDGYFTGAIPFFEYEEDANFLEEIFKHKWSFTGIDQEYYNGHEPLIDVMFDNLSSNMQEKMLVEKVRLVDSIRQFYDDEVLLDIDLYSRLEKFTPLYNFLDKCSEVEENQVIAEHIRKSIEIYCLSIVHHDYVGNNQTRVNYFKDNFRNYVDTSGFNMNEDKMVVKMGSFHTSKGYNFMTMLDMGNHLHELAAFHGNKSLHISFRPRFVEEDGKVVDLLLKEPDNTARQIMQMGKKDAWTLVDVRALKAGVFYYPKKFKLPKRLEDRILRQDFLLIPKWDYDGEVLFDQSMTRLVK